MSHVNPSDPGPKGGRKAIHTRSIEYVCYEREDGLWDVEGALEDRKHFELRTLERERVPVGDPYHSIRVTLTVDDTLRIVKVGADMAVAPFGECSAASLPLPKLVGHTLGRGWRKVVEEVLGNACGCTHMREMLHAAPSAAIQAIPGYRLQIAGMRWPPELPANGAPPHFIGGCVSWRKDGAVVLRHYPQFHVSKSETE